MISDFKHTADGDLDLTTGDLFMADSDRTTEQHKQDMLIASLGDYTEAPLTGVGLVDYINAEDDGDMLRHISILMQRDGIKVEKIEFDEMGDLIIKGGYENRNGRG